MAYANALPVEQAPIAARIEKLAHNYREWRARRVEYNRVYSELSAMSARDLADIGISQHQIQDIARQAAEMI
ncbi:DUF1127 domain-containing protein [Celeribacter sp.]|uniref:DUF1127 domain-containing protein n=1 Tax=Celeribacter sp. TaxID=1890673 RepID=UPI003A8EF17D